MGDTSCGNCSMNKHTLYWQYFGSNNGDVSSGFFFLNSHTLSHCEDSSTLNNIGDGFERGGVSSGYGSMNSHTYLQHNGF